MYIARQGRTPRIASSCRPQTMNGQTWDGNQQNASAAGPEVVAQGMVAFGVVAAERYRSR